MTTESVLLQREMSEISIPPIGTRVEVETSYSIEWMNFPRPPVVGIVSIGNPWDKPGTFRITNREDVFGKTHFESTISIDRVKSIKVLGTSTDRENPDAANIPDLEKAETFEIKGSKDNIYIVTIDGEKSSCTCQAGSHGRLCKHVKAARELQAG